MREPCNCPSASSGLTNRQPPALRNRCHFPVRRSGRSREKTAELPPGVMPYQLPGRTAPNEPSLPRALVSLDAGPAVEGRAAGRALARGKFRPPARGKASAIEEFCSLRGNWGIGGLQGLGRGRAAQRGAAQAAGHPLTISPAVRWIRFMELSSTSLSLRYSWIRIPGSHEKSHARRSPSGRARNAWIGLMGLLHSGLRGPALPLGRSQMGDFGGSGWEAH